MAGSISKLQKNTLMVILHRRGFPAKVGQNTLHKEEVRTSYHAGYQHHQHGVCPWMDLVKKRPACSGKTKGQQQKSTEQLNQQDSFRRDDSGAFISSLAPPCPHGRHE